jgi:prepilin-type processing-associated H-X9-DG protein
MPSSRGGGDVDDDAALIVFPLAIVAKAGKANCWFADGSLA